MFDVQVNIVVCMEKLSDKNLSWAVWLLVISMLLMAVDSLGWLVPVKRVVESELIPVERVGNQVGEVLSWPVRVVGYYKNGLVRIEDLQSRLAEKTVDSQRMSELEQENERMRVLLGVNLPPAWKFLPATVLGQTGGELIIQGGENLGIGVGMSVVSNQVLVGRVSKVSAAVSEVTPVASNQSKIAVKVGGKEITGIVMGNGGRLMLDKVLQEAKVEEGDVVMTDGTDGTLPGLVVGRVVEVGGEQSQVYKTVRLEPMVEMGGLKGVFVVVGTE